MVTELTFPKLDNLKSVPKNICSVLPTFKLSLFASSQFLILVKSLFIFVCNSVVEIEAALKMVSPAYICGLVYDKHLGRSLIYKINNNGPKMEP